MTDETSEPKITKDEDEAQKEDEPLRFVVPAAGVVFEDEQGNTLLSLGRYEDNVSLCLHAPAGRASVVLFVREGGAMITAAANEQPGLSLNAWADGSAISVSDGDGRTVASLSSGPAGGQLLVTDGPGERGWDLNACPPVDEDPALAAMLQPVDGEILH